MKIQFMNIILPLGGLILGAVIGLGFGMIQNVALLRHKKLQHDGKLKSGWAIMPGSMQRTALLIIALAAVQIACPMLFEGDNMQWLVSAGVVVGYGWTLLQQLRQHSTYRA
jgi:hypothetical protein